jgi:hypothetical protein
LETLSIFSLDEDSSSLAPVATQAYAEYLGMGQDTKLTGWSMSKSVTSAGIMPVTYMAC